MSSNNRVNPKETFSLPRVEWEIRQHERLKERGLDDEDTSEYSRVAVLPLTAMVYDLSFCSSCPASESRSWLYAKCKNYDAVLALARHPHHTMCEAHRGEK